MGSETQSHNYYSDVSSPTSNNSSNTSGNNNNNNGNVSSTVNSGEQQGNSMMTNYYQQQSGNGRQQNQQQNQNSDDGGGQSNTSTAGWVDSARQNSLWNFQQNINQQYQRFYAESNNYSNLMAAANASQQQQQQQHHQNQIQQQQSQQQMHVIQTPTSLQTKRLYYSQGKTSNSKDICGDDKHKEDSDPWNVEAQAAFLGPNLWDKTLPYDADLKVHQYADLDEFLSENGIPVESVGNQSASGGGIGGALGGHKSDSLGTHIGAGLSFGLGQVTTKRERSPSPSDCMSPDTMNPASPADSTFSMSSSRDFDPRTRAFSDEELKPQPMIKKSRKQFVPDEMKDDKYWARRRKNNMAAKRSRDARRMKENQIALRAGYLEKENMTLHREVEQLKQENMELRARLSKYQDV